MWSLNAQEAECESFDSQVSMLLSRLTQDTTIWTSLGREFQVDLFCGFFMDTRNQGFTLSIETLKTLAVRGIEPGFDIYAPSNEEEAEYWKTTA
jgi:ribosomal protein L19